MDPFSRKLFRNSGARQRLAQMGGIVASSPELASTVQRFQDGSLVSAEPEYVVIIPGLTDRRGMRVRVSHPAKHIQGDESGLLGLPIMQKYVQVSGYGLMADPVIQVFSIGDKGHKPAVGAYGRGITGPIAGRPACTAADELKFLGVAVKDINLFDLMRIQLRHHIFILGNKGYETSVPVD